MSSLFKLSEKGAAPEGLGPIEFPGAGPETGVDPYDTGNRGGGGGGPTVDTGGNDPFAGSVAGSIPGVSAGGGDAPFAGSTAGSIPGVTPAGTGITGGPGGFGGSPFSFGGGYRAPGLADFLGGRRAVAPRIASAVRRPPPVIGPPAAWTGAGPVANQNPYWIAHLANALGRSNLGRRPLGAYQ